MDSVLMTMARINSLSRNILFELNKDDGSFDEIRSIMDQRQTYIDQFENELTKELIDSLSNGEKEDIKIFFDEFLKINENIRDIITVTHDANSKELNSAKKRRKAEDTYQLSVKPDISYF